MPIPSSFTEFGLDDLGGGKPLAESIYDSLWANLNGNGSVENYGGKGTGGYTDAKVYATAMALARWVATSRRVRLQINPDTVLELLPEREAMYGVVVPYGATLSERRLALRVAMQAPGDGSFGDIYQALSDLLGDRFVDLRRVPDIEQVTKPDVPGASPGLFIKPNGRRRIFKLVANVSGGIPGVVGFAYRTMEDEVVPPEDRIQFGERFVLEGGHYILQERVTASGVATTMGGDAATAGFLNKPHHAGATLAVMPWPYLYATSARWIVELTAPAALDPEVRRQTHRLLRKVTCGWETWDLVGPETSFTLDSSSLDACLLAPAP